MSLRCNDIIHRIFLTSPKHSRDRESGEVIHCEAEIIVSRNVSELWLIAVSGNHQDQRRDEKRHCCFRYSNGNPFVSFRDHYIIGFSQWRFAVDQARSWSNDERWWFASRVGDVVVHIEHQYGICLCRSLNASCLVVIVLYRLMVTDA